MLLKEGVEGLISELCFFFIFFLVGYVEERLW